MKVFRFVEQVLAILAVSLMVMVLALAVIGVVKAVVEAFG